MIDNKTYEARVEEKERAKQEFKAAVDAGISAGLVAQTNVRDSKHFTVSINIEPLKNITCTLRYEEILERTNKTYQFIINLILGQIVPRLTVTCTIEDVLPIINVQTPKFKTTNLITENENGTENPNVRKEFKTPSKVKVVWKPTEQEQRNINENGLNGQMIIMHDVDDSNYSQTVLIDEDGYMVHRIRYNSSQLVSKHVIFVLDVSGSMFGTKIEQLKQAMEKCLNDLSENDYMTIVLFSTKVFIWKLNYEGPISLDDYGYVSEPVNVAVKYHHIIPASKKNIALAIDFVKTNVSTYGATNIMGGLRHGLKVGNLAKQLLFRYCDPPEAIMILLTDGLANVEESNPDRIIENVKELNKNNIRVCALEFGYDADSLFLRKLSLSAGCASRRIYEDPDSAEQINYNIKKMSEIVLSDFKVEYITEVNDTTSITDYLVLGSEIIILGKVDPNSVISGSIIAKSAIQVIVIDIKPIIKKHQNKGLEKMWAIKTIRKYLDEYLKTNNETYKKEALALSLKYKLVTDVTSLIVVKPGNSSLVDDSEVGGPPEFDMGTGGSASGSAGGTGPSGSGSGGIIGIPLSTRYFPTETSPPITTPVPEMDYPENIEIIPYTCVTWLNKTNAHHCPFIVPPKEVDENDLIALNKGNVSYSTCPDGSKCLHFIECPLNVFARNPMAYQPYKCHIPPVYLGVCCPFACFGPQV